MPFELSEHLGGLDVLYGAGQTQKFEIRCPLAPAELRNDKRTQGIIGVSLMATSAQFLCVNVRDGLGSWTRASEYFSIGFTTLLISNCD